MEQIIPILQYLDTFPHSTGFTLHGKMSVERTPLEAVKVSIKHATFALVFPTIIEFQAIDPNWIKENGIIFETITWKGKVDHFWATVTIYLNVSPRYTHIQSYCNIFMQQVHDLSHQAGLRCIYMPQ